MIAITTNSSTRVNAAVRLGWADDLPCGLFAGNDFTNPAPVVATASTAGKVGRDDATVRVRSGRGFEDAILRK
jgi:hypothetical protein